LPSKTARKVPRHESIRSGGKSRHILNIGNRSRVVFSFTLPPFYLRGKTTR